MEQQNKPTESLNELSKEDLLNTARLAARLSLGFETKMRIYEKALIEALVITGEESIMKLINKALSDAADSVCE